MNQYETLLKFIREYEMKKTDRIQTGVRSIFSCQMRFDLEKRFPLVITKRVHLNSVIPELLWLLQGDTIIHHPSIQAPIAA